MRKATVTTKIYLFDELSDEVKETVVKKLWELNINCEWWDSTYEDAATIGLKITEFEIARSAFCRGDWTEEAKNTARLILENHGKTCETYKDAVEFQNSVSVDESIFEAADGFDPDYEEYNESGEYEELCEEFQRTICEDYQIILQKEFNYLTGEKAIIETIKANKYEFTVDGKLY